MSCLLCRSDNQKELIAEMNIHLSGPGNLHNETILVFPKLLLCLDCGFSRVAIPETELRLLREGIAPSAVA
jgi:hypothetical protein